MSEMEKTKKKRPQIIIFLKRQLDPQGKLHVSGIEHVMSDEEVDLVVVDGQLSGYYLKSPWEKHGRLRKHQNFHMWDIVIPKRTVMAHKVRDFMDKFRADILRGRIEGRWKGKSW